MVGTIFLTVIYVGTPETNSGAISVDRTMLSTVMVF